MKPFDFSKLQCRYTTCSVKSAENDCHWDDARINQPRKWQYRRQRLVDASFFTKSFRLALILAVSCFLPGHKICHGNENSASPFQRPPPPPPPPGKMTNDYGGKNEAGEHSNMMQHQEIYPPPSPPQYPDEYNYSQRKETEEYPRQSNPSSSLGGQQQQNPSLPIHYEFPIAEADNMDMSIEGSRSRRGNNRLDKIDDDNNLDRPSATSSARNDLVTRYWSTKTGKAQIQAVVGLVGYGFGNFAAKSLIGGSDMALWTGYFWAISLIVSTWFRTPIGELSRAIGLSLILVLQRTQRIRREYPTWRYVAASVGIIRGGPRDARGRPRGPRPFPPARNPWRYTPRDPRDPDFNMIYTLVSMAMVGSTVGGNLPFIPNWIGALVGASIFSFACTWQNSYRGDLARTMGMRVVRAVSELWEIQADLQIIPKATVVSSQVIDKAMILDRKHRVKDRFLSFANKTYAQASTVAEQIQKQQRGGNNQDQNENGDDTERDRNGTNNRFARGSYDSGRDDRQRSSRGHNRDTKDDRRQRRGYDSDDRIDNDRVDSRSRAGLDERRRMRDEYEDETNDRNDRFSSRRQESNDYDGGRESSNDDESRKKSKGFFFRRK